MVSIRTASLVLAAVILVAGYVVVDTRLGAYIVLDVVGAIGDEEPDFLVVDHNLDEPRPPVYVHDLSLASAAALN
ncbi:MAG: hypothetical protein HKN84_02725 [Gammaproteobacteria bacterium]|nr:hypothetical protein [Gammaproteobacteria bacterium]